MDKKPTRSSEPAICEACGNQFACGANFDSCWCQTIELKPEAFKSLQSISAKCLCPKCLAEYVAEPEKEIQ